MHVDLHNTRGNKMTEIKAPKQQKHRTKANSVSAAAQHFKNSQTKVPLPDVVEFSSQMEVDLWEYVTQARSLDDWRYVDLMMIWKWVKMECELLKQQEELDKEGVVVQGARGGPIENPRVRIMHLYEQRQLSIFRALSLNITKSDPRVVKKNAANEQKAHRIIEAADDLLAGATMN